MAAWSVRVSFTGQALIHFTFCREPIVEFVAGSEAATLRTEIGRPSDAGLTILGGAGSDALGPKVAF